jgi:hypothetical protein
MRWSQEIISVRQIEAVLDLTWVYDELAPHYPSIGRPSIDPVLMIGCSSSVTSLPSAQSAN